MLIVKEVANILTSHVLSVKLNSDRLQFCTCKYKGIRNDQLITTVTWDDFKERELTKILYINQDAFIDELRQIAEKFPDVSLQYAGISRSLSSLSSHFDTLPLKNTGLIRYGQNEAGEMVVTFDENEPKSIYDLKKLLSSGEQRLSFINDIRASIKHKKRHEINRQKAQVLLTELIEKYSIIYSD